jgi:hypothetical protein
VGCCHSSFSFYKVREEFRAQKKKNKNPRNTRRRRRRRRREEEDRLACLLFAHVGKVMTKISGVVGCFCIRSECPTAIRSEYPTASQPASQQASKQTKQQQQEQQQKAR